MYLTAKVKHPWINIGDYTFDFFSGIYSSLGVAKLSGILFILKAEPLLPVPIVGHLLFRASHKRLSTNNLLTVKTPHSILNRTQLFFGGTIVTEPWVTFLMILLFYGLCNVGWYINFNCVRCVHLAHDLLS